MWRHCPAPVCLYLYVRLLSFPLWGFICSDHWRSTIVRKVGTSTRLHPRRRLSTVLQVAATPILVVHSDNFADWLVFAVEIKCVYCEVRTQCCKAVQMNFVFIEPWRGPGGQSPTCHRREPVSITGQSVWDLWWTEWQWNTFSWSVWRPCDRASWHISYNNTNSMH